MEPPPVQILVVVANTHHKSTISVEDVAEKGFSSTAFERELADPKPDP